MRIAKIAGIVLATVCLLGCRQELHDPLLRQQLTTMVSSLNDQDDSAVKKAIDDIDAIITVNSGKMSEEQKTKLSSAKGLLTVSHGQYAARDLDNALKPVDQQKDNHLEGISDAKKLISEAAATF